MISEANAFASTFYFFADTQTDRKKIKRAYKPTHLDTANFQGQCIDRTEAPAITGVWQKSGFSA